MKIATYSFLCAAILVLAACSSVKTQVDASPVVANTFSFVSTGAKPAPAYADSRTQVHTMIQEAITKNLAARKVSHVSSGGDVTVAYLVIAGNNAATTSLNEYFGYQTDVDALVEKVHSEQAIKNQNRDYFEAGTLVIDFVNPKTSKLLKRASINAPILRNLPADAREARIQGIVDQALSGLQISH
jgi:Domain of unknown function (DUF4136)